METKTIMGWFIAITMVLSILGVAFQYSGSQTTREQYNDYTFKSTSQGWQTKIDGTKITFLTLPQQTEEILLDDNTKNLLSQEAFLISYDMNSSYVQDLADLQYLTEQTLNQAGKYAISSQSPCTNATSYQPAIYLAESNETLITLNNNCIILKSKQRGDAILQSQRILYQILGVMQ